MDTPLLVRGGVPEPLVTTSETGTSSSCAKNPSDEKMAKPANTDVTLFPIHTTRVSLKEAGWTLCSDEIDRITSRPDRMLHSG